MSPEGLVPLLVLAMVIATAYLKIGVVLEILRRGLSAGIPAAITFLLALLLSALVMAPVAERCLFALSRAPEAGPRSPASLIAAGTGPLREFLQAHTPERERAAAADLARRVRGDKGAVEGGDLTVLGSAFALAELRVAFQLGFLLLLPLLILDLLIAALLQGMSLHGLSPAAVALPFKLLLFVLCDGWHLLARGLLLGYA